MTPRQRQAALNLAVEEATLLTAWSDARVAIERLRWLGLSHEDIRALAQRATDAVDELRTAIDIAIHRKHHL